jgi:hypothetical protein
LICNTPIAIPRSPRIVKGMKVVRYARVSFIVYLMPTMSYFNALFRVC